jgi:hypothetical protein
MRSSQTYHYGIFDEVPRIVLTFGLRFLIALNFVRFALSFVPAFEGTAENPGAGWINKALGFYRFDGFTLDFVWMVLSTPVIFFAAFYFSSRVKVHRWAFIDVVLCLAWTVAFFIFLYRQLASGLLDFG